MARQNSVEAYRKITESGRLSETRLDVWQSLWRSEGSLTHGELSEFMKAERLANGGAALSTAAERNVSARLCELVKMRCAKEMGSRLCTVTGHRAMTYDVTDELPVETVETDAIGKTCSTLEKIDARENRR